jgi:hypothetical protein
LEITAIFEPIGVMFSFFCNQKSQIIKFQSTKTNTNWQRERESTEESGSAGAGEGEESELAIGSRTPTRFLGLVWGILFVSTTKFEILEVFGVYKD